MICDLTKRVKGICEKLHLGRKSFGVATYTIGKVRYRISLRVLFFSRHVTGIRKQVKVFDAFERFSTPLKTFVIHIRLSGPSIRQI